MGWTLTREEKTKAWKEPQRRGPSLPWKFILLAALPIALSVYFLAWVAPTLVPIPPGTKVPYPAATRFLEEVCSWCGEHRWEVTLIGLGLLASGFALRFLIAAERYYVVLAALVSLALGFTYLSIAAPIDRLINAVEEAVPEDNRVPSYPAREGK